MKLERFLFRLMVRRWFRHAQKFWGGTDGIFNTAGFQHAVKDTFGVLPSSEVAQFLMKRGGATQLRGGCHRVW